MQDCDLCVRWGSTLSCDQWSSCPPGDTRWRLIRRRALHAPQYCSIMLNVLRRHEAKGQSWQHELLLPYLKPWPTTDRARRMIVMKLGAWLPHMALDPLWSCSWVAQHWQSQDSAHAAFRRSLLHARIRFPATEYFAFCAQTHLFTSRHRLERCTNLDPQGCDSVFATPLFDKPRLEIFLYPVNSSELSHAFWVPDVFKFVLDRYLLQGNNGPVSHEVLLRNGCARGPLAVPLSGAWMRKLFVQADQLIPATELYKFYWKLLVRRRGVDVEADLPESLCSLRSLFLPFALVPDPFAREKRTTCRHLSMLHDQLERLGTPSCVEESRVLSAYMSKLTRFIVWRTTQQLFAAF